MSITSAALRLRFRATSTHGTASAVANSPPRSGVPDLSDGAAATQYINPAAFSLPPPPTRNLGGASFAADHHHLISVNKTGRCASVTPPFRAEFFNLSTTLLHRVNPLALWRQSPAANYGRPARIWRLTSAQRPRGYIRFEFTSIHCRRAYVDESYVVNSALRLVFVLAKFSTNPPRSQSINVFARFLPPAAPAAVRPVQSPDDSIRRHTSGELIVRVIARRRPNTVTSLPSPLPARRIYSAPQLPERSCS